MKLTSCAYKMSICRYDDDWRPDCCGIGLPDEKLVVGKTNIRIFNVHKHILSCESKKFKKMFSAESTEEKNHPIEEDPKLFEILLNHFYGIDFRITDLATLWSFYKLGKKYEVNEILKFARYHFKCISITEGDFWDLTECGMFSHPLFVDKLHEYIEENTDDLINSENVFTLPEELVLSILQMNALNICEYDLLLAVTEWGYRNIQEVNSEKLRKFYRHIRFGTLRSDQIRSFYDCYSEAIDWESIKDIFWYLHSTSYSSMPEWCSKNHVVRKLEFQRRKRMVENEKSETDKVIDVLD